jgi:hypothetical protein
MGWEHATGCQWEQSSVSRRFSRTIRRGRIFCGGQAIEAMTTRLSYAGFSAHDAHRHALGKLYGLLQRQAAALSYVEVYWVLAVIAAVMFLGSFLLKRNEPGKGGHVAVH